MRKRLVFVCFLLSVCLYSFQYTVSSGDTLYGLARRYNVDVDDIINLNGLTNKNIKIGQKIDIPYSSQAPSTSKKDTFFEYTVSSGDTLYGLARRYNVDVDDIINLNGLTNKNINIGQKLKIASSATTYSQNKNEMTKASYASSAPLKTDKVYKDKYGILWPHPGRRKSVKGKFPGWVISAKDKDNIVAVSDGLVVYSQEYSHIGMVVMVQNDDGYIYIYGGAGKLFVSKGDRIKKGAIIGTVGLSYKDNKTEVYYTVWKGGYLSNPPKGN